MKIDKLQYEFINTMEDFRRNGPKELLEGLSKQEFFMLLYMKEFQDRNPQKRGIYMTDLSRLFGNSKAFVSRMAKSAEQKGLITRESDENDRRNTCLIITPQGEKLFADNSRCIRDFYSGVFKKYGDDKAGELIRLMNELNTLVRTEMDARKKKGTD